VIQAVQERLAAVASDRKATTTRTPGIKPDAGRREEAAQRLATGCLPHAPIADALEFRHESSTEAPLSRA
jgi:hypothetical protein